MTTSIQKISFQLRHKYLGRLGSGIRKIWYGFQGMQVGHGTNLPAIEVTWPHHVRIGANCQLEAGIYFKFDGIWESGPAITIQDNVFIGSSCEFNINTGIFIENNVNIASGCKFIDHDHGIVAGIRIGAQPSVGAKIHLQEDAWLGVNVVVLKGVTIGTGAVVAAGAVVNKNIGANEIWGGIPAKFIKMRS